MRAHIPIVTLVLLLTPAVVPGLTAATANAEVITVCWDGSGDYLTIQEGIDAASDGDEVVVCDGTYTGEGNKNLDFAGKAITVRSECGPESCIIDCQNDGRGFYFHSGETPEAVLDGFTVTNGNAEHGGGLYCEASSPTITNCTISENTAGEHGGGGGVSCYNSSPTISNCIIADNDASKGAGIYCENDSRMIIRGCTITANIASLYGGGYNSPDSSPQVINCAFIGNSALRGGAMFGGGNPEVFNCRFDSNSAVHYGGAAYLTDFTFRNCVFSNNSAGIFGGGIDIICSSPTLRNCTLTGNSAGGSGGGIYNFEGCGPSSPILENCILWENSDSGGEDESAQIAGGTPVFDYSCVQGWTGQLGGCGNIDLDPGFRDPDSGDYHLSPGSPCIDAACNWGVPPDVADLDDDGDTSEITPFDLDGEGRFFDDPDTPDTGCGCPPIVDMGAYEFGDAGPQPCPGDLDCDRRVDQFDLMILLAAWQGSAEGDLNCDGVTDQSDLGLLLAHWGEGCP